MDTLHLYAVCFTIVISKMSYLSSDVGRVLRTPIPTDRWGPSSRRAALDLLASSFCIPEPREAVSRHLEPQKSNSTEICCHSSNNNTLLPCTLLLCSSCIVVVSCVAPSVVSCSASPALLLLCSRPSWLEGCLDSWAAPRSASPAPD